LRALMPAGAALAVMLAAVVSCATEFGHRDEELRISEVVMFLSSGDGSMLLERQAPPQSRRARSGDPAVRILSGQRFQQIDGFGASMTESSAYAISLLPEDERDRLMIELFDADKGIGISMLRQPMGSPDFALSTYSYNDLPPGEEDFDLEAFSIDRDREYIIPLLKRALEINPDLKIMASPWSPPAWMKTGGSMIGAEGGELRRDCYEVYAEYFVRFIRSYEAEGIPIFAVSVQNEPNYAPAEYAGSFWPKGEEARFIAGSLGPEFEREGIEALILCYDHNWDRPDLARATLDHPGASPYIAGSAWHYYGGDASVMGNIHQSYPDKGIWFTEGSTGIWIGGGSFSATFNHGMRQAIDIMNNWSRSLIWWNIALDENNGPIVFENQANYGLVRIDTRGGKGPGQRSAPHRASWYTLGHFAKFVSPGAVRIGLDFPDGTVTGTAFENPDGSIIAVLYNPNHVNRKIALRYGEREYDVLLTARTAATLVLRRGAETESTSSE
jgi:glucosylceramidase